MNALERSYPIFVSALGSVGLGTTLAYLIGVGLLFAPGFEAWVAFFLGWGPALVAVPGSLLIAHLYLRTHLGRWYLERGRISEAVDYTSERLDHGLLRSRKEALYNRIYLGRARVAAGDYEEALELLTTGFAVPTEGREAALLRRWEMEAALRAERPERIEEAYERGLEASPSSETRAALNGARAEWAVLEGSRESYHTCIDRGRWADETNWRVDLAEGFGAVRFGRGSEDFRAGLANLEEHADRARLEVPGRAPEVDAVRAQLLARLGRPDEARELLEMACRGESDARSRRRIEHVKSQLDAYDEGSNEQD